MSGSPSTTLLTFSCAAFIAGKDTSCAASVLPRMSPVSCWGKSPWGTSMKRTTVTTTVRTVTPCMMRW